MYNETGDIFILFYLYLHYFFPFNSKNEIFLIRTGEWKKFFSTNHLEPVRFIFLRKFSFQKFACLIRYIGYVHIYHIFCTELNQNHKKLFYCIFYLENILLYFRLESRRRKGKKLIEFRQVDSREKILILIL